MYVDIITFIYNLYNTDPYKNKTELKRFDYILNGTVLDGVNITIDILRRGQGLDQSKELEENIAEAENDIETLPEATTDEEKEELEDLREEAESLDVETDYYAEEDEDYAQVGDNE
jgi:hypothetical protein